VSHRFDAPSEGNSSSPTGDEASTGQLVVQLSDELTQLMRDEFRLAQLEMTGKAKKAGIGAGMFGAAGLLALYGGGVLIATLILALALVLDAWVAALIVGAVLLAAAGIVALVGKKRVQEATPPIPSQAMDSVKRDIETVRQARNQ
jgi:membrane protein